MNRELIKKLADHLKNRSLNREIRIMEVCGTHTAQFFKTGVKDILPKKLTLINGPGCPVCVTPNRYLDSVIEIAKKYNAIIATFGDMIKVPSSYSSLAMEKSNGMDIRIIYSPVEALDIAKANKNREVVLISVGFETTAPSEAITLLEADAKGIKNFSLMCGNKLTPPAVNAILNSDEVKIDGFIIPGHVSAIIGKSPWSFIADKYGKPGVIAGFETEDLVTGVLSLIDMIEDKNNTVKNGYTLAVKDSGNLRAMEIIDSVFDIKDTEWRGLGNIPASGLAIKKKYSLFDAEKKFPVTPSAPKEHPGCRCGDLLRGLITPPECPLFDKGCSPERAVGPCMVSSEGPCAAYYKYWRK
ncbi:MAG: hydrogenase formation protein HypD [Spirochaetota bacterium]